MTFRDILAEAIDWLQQDKCVSFRALKRQFDMDDAYLDDLKLELIKVRQLAVDPDGEMLIWIGAPATPEADNRHLKESEGQFQTTLRVVMTLLQSEKRITYRTLKYVFGFDDARMAEIREELRLRHLAIDEESKVLVWTGETPPSVQPREVAPQPHMTATDTTTHGHPASSEDAPVAPPSNKQLIAPHPGRITPEAERRQLTVMFCDLAGSTDLSGRLDPEDLREVVRAYQETAAGVIKRYEGHIAQYLGDGLLIYFGYPLAHEDDAQRAVHTGMGIVEAMSTLNTRLKGDHDVELAVRIGIHTGPVVVGEIGVGDRHENLALGETPNIAARLEGLAQPNSLVISHVTARLVQRAFVLEALGPHELKGLSEPIVISRVIGSVEPEASGPAMQGFEALVGRDEEIGLLLRRWEQTKESVGQVVLLSGEAGIGKSSLVEGLRRHVYQEGYTRLAFRCSPYHTNSAFFPIIERTQRALNWQTNDTVDMKLTKLEQALEHTSIAPREAVPLLAELLSLPLPEDRYPALTLSPQQQRQQTLDVLVAWLLEEAERQPVLVVWEDFHWADPSTLETLGLFVDQAPTAAMLHIVTYRPEFEPPWPARSHLTPMTLSRLERSQVEAIIARLAGDRALPTEVVQHIVGKTDGVPLYVEELTKMLLESDLLREEVEQYVLTGPLSMAVIPDTLQDSLMARLDQFSTAKEVAQLGAVLGRKFGYEMLHSISGQDETTLQGGLSQLVAAELLYQRGRPPKARYIFKHALIQDAAYASLLRSTRQKVHRQIAQILETRFPELVETQPELVAHHFTEAGCGMQAIVYWQQAGQRTRERAAYIEAQRYFTRGLESIAMLPETPERVLLELDVHLALGAVLAATKGQGSAEAEQAYLHAQVLGRPLCLVSRAPGTVWGLFYAR